MVAGKWLPQVSGAGFAGCISDGGTQRLTRPSLRGGWSPAAILGLENGCQNRPCLQTFKKSRRDPFTVGFLYSKNSYQVASKKS